MPAEPGRPSVDPGRSDGQPRRDRPERQEISEDGRWPLSAAVAFARLLRRRQLDVPVHAVTTFAEALEAVGMAQGSAVYWAARTTLVHRPDDIGAFDQAFAAFWGNRPEPGAPSVMPEPVVLALDDDHETDGVEPDHERFDGPALVVRYTARETLRNKDFADCSEEELAELHRALARLRVVGDARRSRRLAPTHRTDGRPHLRRTVRDSLRTGGEPMRRRYRAPLARPRRLVLLVDVSGSMEPYARALIRFAHAAVVGRRSVEVFTFGTRLTRITRELASHQPDAAVAAAAAAVADWSGGTRLGESLRDFNDRWGTPGAARGATVVILSDGWDRGDPTQLAGEMARLSRAAHRIIWVNPLKAASGYQPLARGMAAALPHVDDFVEGHALTSLEHLVHTLGRSTRHDAPRSRQLGRRR